MPVTGKESKIPVGTQFSPDLVNLLAFAKMAVKNSGDVNKLREEVVKSPVRIKPYASPPTHRMKGLPLEAGVQYGLLTKKTYEATDLTKKLATLNEPAIYKEFAKHILLNLSGLRVVTAAQEMAQDRLTITGDTLSQYLTNQGFRVTIHNTAINTMRMWLAKAGLFPEGKGNQAWMPNLAVKEKIIGMDDKSIATLAGLTDEQIAFVKVLCRLQPSGWIGAAQVRDMAETTLGVHFGRASLPKEVLIPLSTAGLIEYSAKGTKGGKTSLLRLTEKFHAEVLSPFLETTLSDLNKALTAYYNTRPEDIFSALQSKNKYTKGHALEAFTIYVMRLLGLRFLGWRRRAAETGYSEVDVLLAGLFGGLPTTWQVQCKNTPTNSVKLEDVAKEIGILPLTNATHIILVANASFTQDARKFAREIMSRSSITLFLLDKTDFEAIKKEPINISCILRGQAERIHELRMTEPIWNGAKNQSPEQPKESETEE